MSDPSRERVVRTLRALIRRQHAANAAVTLSQIRSGKLPPYQLDPMVIAYFRDERAAVLDALRTETESHAADQPDLLSGFVSEAESYINQNNQFIALSADERAHLESVYSDYLRDLTATLTRAGDGDVETGIHSVQRRHLRRLRGLVSRLARRDADDGRGLVDSGVVCGEYSANLQLAVLGMSVERLVAPILDVGCGQSATLVRFLRESGLDARGLDRLAAPSECVVRADWLSYDYGRARWGTVISHLGFANHFLFNHLYSSGQPEAYARAYARILASLTPGGAFCYTPSLPFIERLLPMDRFAVEGSRAPLPETTDASPFGEAYQESIGHATRVTRLT